MISTLDARVALDAGPLPITDVRADLDEDRAPYASASFAVPYTPEAFAALDPRWGPRVRLHLEQRYAGSATAEDLTIEHGPTVIHRRLTLPFTIRSTSRTVADLTAAWDLMTADDVSALYEAAWNAGDRRMPARRPFDLTVVSRTRNRRDGTITVEACSDEQLLTDYRLVSTGPVMAGAFVRDVVLLALGMAVSPSTYLYRDLSDLVPDPLVEVDARVWEPGQSAWDFTESVTASKGLRLWCDELRRWHLVPAEMVRSEVEQHLDTTADVTDVEDTTSTDGYADAVVVTYQWRDAAGEQRTVHETAGTPTRIGPDGRPAPVRVLAFDIARPYPGPGEAAHRLAKVSRAGRTVRTDAVANPAMTPAHRTVLSTPTGPLRGYASAVSWSVPDDRMTVTIHDTEEV